MNYILNYNIFLVSFVKHFFFFYSFLLPFFIDLLINSLLVLLRLLLLQLFLQVLHNGSPLSLFLSLHLDPLFLLPQVVLQLQKLLLYLFLSKLSNLLNNPQPLFCLFHLVFLIRRLRHWFNAHVFSPLISHPRHRLFPSQLHRLIH
jgi:hypothetical protein